MDISFLVMIAILVIASIGVKLGYDPVWFILLCLCGCVTTYFVTLFPIHASQWIQMKLFGG